MQRNEVIGIICACIGAFGFSTKAIFIKMSYDYHVDAETLLALRMLYSLPFFVFMIIWGRYKARNLNLESYVLKRKDFISLFLLGFFGYYLASYLDFLGLMYISATLERLLLFVYPTFVIVLSRIFLKKRIPFRFYPAIFLCYLGVVIVMLEESSQLKVSDNSILGSSLVILSALSYAIYLMITGEVVKKMGSMTMVAYASTIACVLSVTQFFILKPASLLITQPLPVHLLSICIALLSTVIPILLLAEAIARLGASLASIIGTLGPVFTIALAIFFLNEPINIMQLLGAMCIIFGILLATLNFDKKRASHNGDRT